jgi:hypothetical protein
MRPSRLLPRSRAAHAALGVSILGVPTTAVALAAPGGDPPAASTVLPAQVASSRIAYRRNVVLTGRGPAGEDGQRVTLELLPTGSRSWRAVASSRVHRDGSFRLEAPLRRSGAVRALASWTQGAPQPQEISARPATAASGGAQPSATAAGDGAHPVSAPQRVAVGAKFQVPGGSINLMGSQPVDVRGRLLPGQGGRRVRLQALRDGGWRTVATTRTGRRGNFELRWTPDGNTRLLVRFAGDRYNLPTAVGAGRVTIYQPSVASWYDDGGATACGFHAYYGVANLSLPCGTKVRFYYHGRSVTAVVQDRGPYGAGRTWDLNQNLAAALGFDGVDTVWTSQP